MERAFLVVNAVRILFRTLACFLKLVIQSCARGFDFLTSGGAGAPLLLGALAPSVVPRPFFFFLHFLPHLGGGRVGNGPYFIAFALRLGRALL